MTHASRHPARSGGVRPACHRFLLRERRAAPLQTGDIPPGLARVTPCLAADRHPQWLHSLPSFLGLALAGALLAAPLFAQQRVHLTPRYAAGQSLRYALEFRTATESSSAGAVENPQAPKKVEISVSAIIRVEVLRVEPGPANPAGAGRVRLRTTYERLAAKTASDVPDPALADQEEQYRALEGKSIEYTQEAAGTVTDIKGLEDYAPEARAAFTEWLGRLSLGIAQPAEGVALGQKWNPPAGPRTQPAPIEGIRYLSESQYLRNEPCRVHLLAPDAKAKPAAASGECAVVLTKFTIAQSELKDQTPEEYKKRGLRTSGRLSGAAESLTYVSLATGFVVGVTQDGAEEMDITITHPDNNLRMRYEGKVKTRSQISLITEGPAGK